LRPIYHQLQSRIEAHIFVAFLAYCLHVTLRARLRPVAGGLTPRSVLDKFAAIQMLDVKFPTTDGRTLILSRYTSPTPIKRSSWNNSNSLYRPSHLRESRPAANLSSDASNPRCSGDLLTMNPVSIGFFPPLTLQLRKLG